MADSPCTTEGGPSPESDRETTVPQTGLRAALDTFRGQKKDTPREIRRKDWQRKKIQDSRTKTRSTQDAVAGDQHNDDGPRLPASQAQAPLSNTEAVHAAAESQIFPFDRTPDEWKIICELKLCARCLTKTSPPHKPRDKRAPCQGSQGVPYDAKEITAIRRSLSKDANKVWLKAASRHSLARGTHHGKSEQSLSAPSTSRQHESFHGVAPRVPQSGSGNSMRGKRPLERHFPTADDPTLFAPIYNLHHPSSCAHLGIGDALHRRYGPAPSQSSATHVDSSMEFVCPEQPQRASIPWIEPMTPTRREAVLSIDMMGMTPTTPSTTGPPPFLNEDDLGTVNQVPPNAANIPISESSGRVPRLGVEDWDSKTKVSDGAQASGLESALVDGLTSTSSSKDIVDWLIPDKLDIKQCFAERSDTTPGLYCSLVGTA